MAARIVVVGAGIAGVVAARRLTEAGHAVVVVDKGRKPGGRMASRHIEQAVFDSGAQFITAKDPWFRGLLRDLEEEGAVAPWFSGSPDPDGSQDGHARYRGAPYQRAVCERLARDLHLRLGVTVTEVACAGGWRVSLGRERLEADAVVLTPPVPQTRALMAGVDLGPAVRAALEEVAYDPCLAAMVTLDAPIEVGNAGALRLDDEPVSWLGDNHTKGVSPVPALTIHAGPASSRAWWDDAPQDVADRLVAASRPWIGDAHAQLAALHRWRYSRPRGGGEVEGGALVSDRPAPIAFAGDGLAGGRVEGAAVSGQQAAARLLALLAS